MYAPCRASPSGVTWVTRTSSPARPPVRARARRHRAARARLDCPAPGAVRGPQVGVGYVEALAVRPDARRRGGRVTAAVEQIVERAYDVGALSASDEGAALYACMARGCGPAGSTPSASTARCGCRTRRARRTSGHRYARTVARSRFSTGATAMSCSHRHPRVPSGVLTPSGRCGRRCSSGTGREVGRPSLHRPADRCPARRQGRRAGPDQGVEAFQGRRDSGQGR